jgi:hypothetical protein
MAHLLSFFVHMYVNIYWLSTKIKCVALLTTPDFLRNLFRLTLNTILYWYCLAGPQVFSQAEKWHLNLETDLSELENR